MTAVPQSQGPRAKLPANDHLRKLGWHTMDTRELVFDDCCIPDDHLIGEEGNGLRQFLEVLDAGRISVAAPGLSLAQTALDLALRHATEREQFGTKLSRFQAIGHKLADMATEVEAARALVYCAAWLGDQGRPFSKEAAMAKLYTSEVANRAASASVQIHGGYGYVRESAISRFYDHGPISHWLRPVLHSDAAFAGLSARGLNAFSHGVDLVGADQAELVIDGLGQQLWGTPMIAWSATDEPLGVFALTNVDNRDLNGELFALFAGTEAAAALRRYLEVVFWAFPLRRIAAAALRPGGTYREVLVRAGFTSEGVLDGAALRGGRPIDIEIFATIRPPLEER